MFIRYFVLILLTSSTALKNPHQLILGLFYVTPEAPNLGHRRLSRPRALYKLILDMSTPVLTHNVKANRNVVRTHMFDSDMRPKYLRLCYARCETGQCETRLGIYQSRDIWAIYITVGPDCARLRVDRFQASIGTS